MKLKFTPQFLKQLNYLKKLERKSAERIMILIEAIEENPFEGIGKPEKLKYRENTYSRRRLLDLPPEPGYAYCFILIDSRISGSYSPHRSSSS